MSGCIPPLHLMLTWRSQRQPYILPWYKLQCLADTSKKISTLPFLCAKRITGSAAGFLGISRKNTATSQNRHQNFRLARIHRVASPSVRQNTTQNTCNMWNNILASDSIYRLNFERSKTFRNFTVLLPSDEHEANRVGFRNVILWYNRTFQIPHSLYLYT